MRFSFDNLTQVVFWTKVEHFYKKSVKEVSPQITISESTKSNWEKLSFLPFTQKQLEIHDGTKNRLNTLLHQLLGEIIRGTNEIHTFFW